MKCACLETIVPDRRVVIQKPKISATPDAAGHIDLTSDSNWQDVLPVYVKISTRGGRESRVFDQMQAETTHVIDMFSTTVTRTIIPKWRLKLGSRKLNITAAYDVDDAHQVVRCECTEAV